MLVRTFKFVISPYIKGDTHLSHKEALIASVGAFIAISLIFLFTIQITNNHNAAALIAGSTGATAFLIFTLPDSIFSKNWSVIAGQTISAFIGVSCFKLLGSSIIATSLSVALAVIGMHLLRCPHPPGAATALLAIVGGEPVTQLGYGYVVFPILANILSLLAIAYVLNSAFKYLHRSEAESHIEEQDIQHFKFIKIIDELRDGTEDLLEGCTYSHSQHAFHASIRKVLSISNDQVRYEVIHGFAKGTIECVSYTHFISWVRFKVCEVEYVA